MLNVLKKIKKLDEYLDTLSEDSLTHPEQEVEIDYEVIGIATTKIKKLFHLIVGTEIIYEEMQEQHDVAKNHVLTEALHFYDAIIEMEIRASYDDIKPENSVCICKDWKVVQYHTEITISYVDMEFPDEEEEKKKEPPKPLLN